MYTQRLKTHFRLCFKTTAAQMYTLYVYVHETYAMCQIKRYIMYNFNGLYSSVINILWKFELI